MKSNKWNLIAALLYLAASIFFAFAAALGAEMPPKVLAGIAAVCFLISGIGFLCTYTKKRKTNDN